MRLIFNILLCYMDTILVTGGAGFVGSNLCARLLRDGHKVFCLDNFSTGRKQNIAALMNNKNFQLLEADVENFSNDIKVDQIYHLASPASPPTYQKDPIKTLRTNFLGTLNVLELADRSQATIALASTSEVYGDPAIHPQPESYWGNVNPLGPRSCYDEGKRAAESLCMAFARQHKAKIKIARIFNTYGPNMDPNDGRVVSNFITAALGGQPLTVYGDGSQTRSFQYIDDLLEGLTALMESPEDFTGPVNLGNPEEFTVKELAEKILKKVPESGGKISFLPLPQDDPRKRKPDIALAKQKLGWSPKIKLEEGLDKTIEYFRNF